jgi:hypothetical protein
MTTSKDRSPRTAPEAKLDKLSRLKKRKCIIGDPEDIVHMGWLHEWTELKNNEPLLSESRKKK